MKKRCLILVLLALLALSGMVNSQSSAVTFVQGSIEAAFFVDHAADTTRVVYSFGYIQPSEPIRWLVPVPADTTGIQLADWSEGSNLQGENAPFIEPPYSGGCDLSPTLTYFDGFPMSYIDLPPGDSSMMRFAGADEALAWMAAGDMQLTDRQQAAIRRDVEAGYHLVGVGIAPRPAAEPTGYPVEIDRTPSITFEYPGTDIVLPLGFRSDQAATLWLESGFDDTMPVLVQIFADVPYVPENFDLSTVDMSSAEWGGNQLSRVLRATTSPLVYPGSYDSLYYRGMNAMSRAANGQAFALEYRAKPGSRAPFDRYDYQSRFVTLLRPEDDVPDAVFVPAPDAPDYRYSMNVDPADFWGCTSRTLIDPELESRLPAGRTRIDPIRIYAAHPEDWQLSAFNDSFGTDLYVLSPEPVTRDTLRTLEFRGEGPPMLVFAAFKREYLKTSRDFILPDPTWEWFTRTGYYGLTDVPGRNAYTVYHPTYQAGNNPYYTDEPVLVEGVRMALLAPMADWAANGALYNDLLAYAATYQYYMADSLRHTLFIGDLHHLVGIGYPEGWIETLIDGERFVLPENTPDYAESAYVRAYRYRDDVTALLQTAYGLSDLTEAPPIGVVQAFDANGRRGFVMVHNGDYQIYEISAPENQYAEYAELLSTIADTLVVNNRDVE